MRYLNDNVPHIKLPLQYLLHYFIPSHFPLDILLISKAAGEPRGIVHPVHFQLCAEPNLLLLHVLVLAVGVSFPAILMVEGLVDVKIGVEPLESPK